MKIMICELTEAEKNQYEKLKEKKRKYDEFEKAFQERFFKEIKKRKEEVRQYIKNLDEEEARKKEETEETEETNYIYSYK